jgi:hypothetical protein
MISDSIGKQIAQAMKSGDETRLTTLRLLSSAIHNAEIDKHDKLSEEEELAVIKREVKKRQDAIDIYSKAQDQDKAGPKRVKEEKELAILQDLLPEQLSDEELARIVNEAISATGASQISDMGRVIGSVMGKAKGTADGKKVSELVRKALGTSI